MLVSCSCYSMLLVSPLETANAPGTSTGTCRRIRNKRLSALKHSQCHLSNRSTATAGGGFFWICFLYYWPTGLNRKFYGNFNQKDLPLLIPRPRPPPHKNPSNNPQKTRPDILGGTANRPGTKRLTTFTSVLQVFNIFSKREGAV